MVYVNLTNAKSQIYGDVKILMKIRDKFKIKSPGYFFSEAWRSRRWDGYINYITDRGYFESGLLPQIVEFVKKELGEKIKIIDKRGEGLKLTGKIDIPGIELRDYQAESIDRLINNKVKNTSFSRGILKMSTNAGKTLIAAGIHKSYKGARTIVLFNNSTLFHQFMNELPPLLGKDFGYLHSSETKWAPFMIAMVPTLVKRIHTIQENLLDFDIVIVDECHLASSKTYQAALSSLYNAQVRVGMSGSPLDMKDKTKQMKVTTFFGNILYEISSKEIEDMGYSVPLKIRVHRGYEGPGVKGNFKKEYDLAIVNNKTRNVKIWKLARLHLKKERFPLLIIIQRHEHINQLMATLPKELKADYLIKFIHHKVKNRNEILDEFREGKVDILISSMIIKIGQNLPLIRAMIFAGAGDSDINTIQLLGRGKRKHESKKKVIIDDFYDEGHYLRRHSKHRIIVYKKQNHQLIEKYKLTKD